MQNKIRFFGYLLLSNFADKYTQLRVVKTYFEEGALMSNIEPEQNFENLILQINELRSQRDILEKERDELKGHLFRMSKENEELQKYKTWAPPGHFYSPIPSIEDIKQHDKEIFTSIKPKLLLGIDLNMDQQLELVGILSKYYSQIPFQEEMSSNLRYYFNNV